MACRVAVLILTSLIVAGLVGCGGGGGGGSITFTGRVVNSVSAEPIEGVAVHVGGKTVHTDADGAFSITVSGDGDTYMFSFTKDGFEDADSIFAPRGGDSSPYSLGDVEMTPLPD